MSEEQLYHAHDGDERKLKDKFGQPILVRVLGVCCHHDTGNACQQIRCENAKTGEPLWFFPSSLRKVKE